MKKFQKPKSSASPAVAGTALWCGANGDEVIQPYICEAQERLVAGLGHRPSLERWAATAGVPVSELKLILARETALVEIAGMTVEVGKFRPKASGQRNT